MKTLQQIENEEMDNHSDHDVFFEYYRAKMLKQRMEEDAEIR